MQEPKEFKEKYKFSKAKLWYDEVLGATKASLSTLGALSYTFISVRN